jgi:hypothetical protein
MSAVLLTDVGASSQEGNLLKLLGFFGAPWRTLTMAEFLSGDATQSDHTTKHRVLCSSGVFLRLMEQIDGGSNTSELWKERVHSAFVFAGDGAETLRHLGRRLTGDNEAFLEINARAQDLMVSDSADDFCGVMSGIRVALSPGNGSSGIVSTKPKPNVVRLISAGDGAFFLRADYQDVPVFLTANEIIDIDEQLASRNFDVRDHFLSAAPPVLYIKWAFAGTCWHAPEANACLVIDDPLLRPNYGCVNFEELLALMGQHRFSTNIAFIPWNWRRSDPKVAALFKQKPEEYSLSIHGCDHTAAEFGSRDRACLCRKARQSIDRMSGHETKTGIRHDRIMVFPQGVFSEAAMSVLKHSNFIAAVNTEVASTDPDAAPIKISDAWDIAVLRYNSFPIFTRRYPSQGIENFAFDILLGKPCIVVIHHDFCCDRYKHLVAFIDRLNALKQPLTWRTLGQVVKRSCRQRELSSGIVETEMYGRELQVENRFAQRKRFLVRKREADPSEIRDVRAGAQEIAWNCRENSIEVEFELNPGETRTIAISFAGLDGNGPNGENLSYRVKTAARRYLSELRDNYVVKNKLRFASIFQ